MTISNCLTSKERVESVFAGQIPDRPAIGFYAIDSDTAGKILGRETYWRAKAKSQIGFWEGRRDEVVQSWIEDGIELYKKLDFIDVVPVSCESAGVCPPKNYDPNPPKQIDETTWESKDGKVYRYSPITKDIVVIKNPSVKLGSIDLDEEKWDGKITPPDESIFEVVDAFIAAFGRDRFVLGLAADELAWFLPGGMETGFMELVMRPDQVKDAYLSKVAKANAHDKYFIRLGQSGIIWGTDLACQNGPMLGPQMYRDLFLDGFSQRIASVKSLGQTVIKHMCGNNWPLLDAMVEAGIDCYQSVQHSAGMDIAEVQRQYKEKFVVWGGLPVEYLIDGTTEDVRKAVQKVMTEVAPNGRFIFGTTHSIAVGTKYDNFMAMMDELSRYI
jgi:hypothetical protein